MNEMLNSYIEMNYQHLHNLYTKIEKKRNIYQNSLAYVYMLLSDAIYLVSRQRYKELHILVKKLEKLKNGIFPRDIATYYFVLATSYIYASLNTDLDYAESMLIKASETVNDENAVYGVLMMKMAELNLRKNKLHKAEHYKNLACKYFHDTYNIHRIALAGILEIEINLRTFDDEDSSIILEHIKVLESYDPIYIDLIEMMRDRIAVQKKDIVILMKSKKDDIRSYAFLLEGQTEPLLTWFAQKSYLSPFQLFIKMMLENFDERAFQSFLENSIMYNDYIQICIVIDTCLLLLDVKSHLVILLYKIAAFN